MALPRTISIPLPEEFGSFLTFMSSEEYEVLLIEGFTPADILYTFFFRYPKLFSADILGHANTLGFAIDFTEHHGAVTAGVTGAIAIAALGFFIHALRNHRKQKQENSYGRIYQKLDEYYAKAKLPGHVAEQVSAKEELTKIEFFNECLKKGIANNDALKDKYESVRIDGNSSKYYLQFTPRPEEKNKALPVPGVKNGRTEEIKKHQDWVYRQQDKVEKLWVTQKIWTPLKKKILDPVYDTTGLASFAYWLEWIGVGIYTAAFIAGVAGLPISVMFGVPLGFGLLYPIIKFSNHPWVSPWLRKIKPWVPSKDKLSNIELQDIKDYGKDAAVIMRQTFECMKHDSIENDLKKLAKANAQDDEFKFEDHGVNTASSGMTDDEVRYLTKGMKKKAAAAMLSDTMSTYITVQYGAWIGTDMLTRIFGIVAVTPVVNVALGWTLLAVSVLRGFYKVVTGHYKRQGDAIRAIDGMGREGENDKTLESRYYKLRYELVTELKFLHPDEYALLMEDEAFVRQVNEIKDQIFSDDNYKVFGYAQKEKTWFESLREKALTRIYQGFNGATSGAYVMRIFTVPGTAIALPPMLFAICSNPVTIALVITAGVLYGVFKAIDYHYKRKQAHAEAALEKRVENLNRKRQQVDLADKLVQVFKYRLNSLKAPVPAAVSTVIEEMKSVGLPEQNVTRFSGSMYPSLSPDATQIAKGAQGADALSPSATAETRPAIIVAA